MMDCFEFDLDETDTGPRDRDFTLSEIATSIIPALIALGFLVLLAVSMSFYHGIRFLCLRVVRLRRSFHSITSDAIK